MTTATVPDPTGTPPARTTGDERPSLASRLLRLVLTQRIALLVVLLVAVVITMTTLSQNNYLSAPYSPSYMSATLINLVPLVLLGLAELLVITSGRGGIDLSVGAIVSLTGMVFGFAYGQWGWSLLAALALAVAFGALCGALNGVLVAYVGFPALITTLATYYAFRSLALVINDQQPISTKPVQDLYSTAAAVQLPFLPESFPRVPLGIFTFLVPTVVVVWLVLARTTWGRRLYAVGTNDVAAEWTGIDVRRTRFSAYVAAGAISGLVAVVTVAQFASARPDAGVSGTGMALPAITIAVLGGVAITGGIGRVAGVVLAALLVVWLNAGILLAVPGNAGTQLQLFALGAVLVFAALLNGITNRRYGGTQ
ncbi:ABC transporter permease [Klenkia brasiliensis]|uniref:Erythritol transport system permease protein n=1 Tax=Klenkia brasiliensis TaxID=333142 RepID=A0A1G7UUJ7_9ACTN|nr:ABC transporter permease [Klenkia brasiliensis]SDG51212.1 erythritol transport system permease protein [Klenkia brasiliensis]